MTKERDFDPAVLDDRGLYTVWLSPTCVYCRHYDLKADNVCPAFPDGIPDEIWNGQNDHTTPYPGDHGIRFGRAQGDDE